MRISVHDLRHRHWFIYHETNIMTLYIVRAKPKNDLSGLRKELELGKISKLRPFGETLHHSLQNARFDTSNDYAMWMEEDYCSPPSPPSILCPLA